MAIREIGINKCHANMTQNTKTLVVLIWTYNTICTTMTRSSCPHTDNDVVYSITLLAHRIRCGHLYKRCEIKTNRHHFESVWTWTEFEWILRSALNFSKLVQNKKKQMLILTIFLRRNILIFTIFVAWNTPSRGVLKNVNSPT